MCSKAFSLPYYTQYAYDPRGRGDENSKSRKICAHLKRNSIIKSGGETVTMVDLMVRRIKDRIDSSIFEQFFGDDVVAVPMPSSSLQKKDSLWVPREICESLFNNELVGSISPCILRNKAVTKSATAGHGNRPNPKTHCKSFGFNVDPYISNARRVLLVDDLVTRGSTMVGAYMHLKNNGVLSDIFAFALIRTEGLGNFTKVNNPVIGRLTCSASGSPNRIDS